MDDNKKVITFDFGTQSVRCMIVNKKGVIEAIGKSKYEEPYYSKELGFAEQSFDVYWKNAIKASNELYEKDNKIFDDAIAVTVTNFRDTFTPTDEFGNPIRDFILWFDTRKAKCEKKLPLKSRLAFALVGMSNAANEQRKITRQNWIKEEEKEIWAKMKKFASLNAIINKKMTGNFVEVDASCIGHVPIDYKRRTWMKKTNPQFPVFSQTLDTLPKLVKTGDIIGYIKEDCAKELKIPANLPLIATGADKNCETIGSGVIDEQTAVISFGTAVTVELITKKYVTPDSLLPSYPSIIKDRYNPEVQIYRGLWMSSWFIEKFAYEELLEAKKKNVCPEEILNSHLKDVPLGCDGLMLLPHWTPPLKKPEAKGAIIGFVPGQDKYYMYRAIIEGICYTLYDGFKLLEKRAKYQTKYFVISGGGANSDEICQIAADVMGLPIKRTVETEATGIGSSIAAFVALKEFSSFESAVKSMVRYNKTFLPNEENHKKYMELYYKVYKKIYPKLKPVFNSYRKIKQ